MTTKIAFTHTSVCCVLLSFFLGCSNDVATTIDPAAAGEPDGIARLAIEDGCNPLASTDECLFPFPSRFFQVEDPATETGWRTAFHQDVLDIPRQAPSVDFRVFNQADGHSPSAPLLVHFGQDVHESFLIGQYETELSMMPNSPIALFDMVTGEQVPLLIEMDRNRRTDRYAGRHALILRPMNPMHWGHRHVAVITRSVTDTNNESIETPAGFAALRDGTPTNFAALEETRNAYDEIFGFLANQGYARDELLLAWDFQVASRKWVLGGILSMRERGMAIAAERGSLRYTIDHIEENPNENTLRIVEGSFQVPNFLTEENQIIRRDDASAVMQSRELLVPYTMVIPKRAETESSLPLVLLGHGVFGNGRDYLTGGIGRNIVQPLAEETGAIIVATDFIGLSSGDRDTLINELVNDLNRMHFITDRLQQSILNNLVLVELARDAMQHDALISPERGPLLNDQVYYYGVSLGGIQGASIVSLSSRINRAVISVPGGSWSNLLPRSIVYAPVQTLVELNYPDPLLQQAYIAMMQTRFDGTDGINIGHLFQEEPLPDAPNHRTLIIQEAIGDCQVPNVSSRMLARVLGLRQLFPAVEPVFGLEPIDSASSHSVLSQFAMPDRLNEYSPPIDNMVPERDNGTHSDAIRLPPAFEQLKHLLRYGLVDQFCEGACDPN